MRALFFMNCNYKKGFSKAYAHEKLIIKKKSIKSYLLSLFANNFHKRNF